MRLPDAQTLRDMPGRRVLALLQDMLNAEAFRIRSFEEKLVQIGTSLTANPDRIALCLAIESASQIVLKLTALGHELEQERAGQPPKWASGEGGERRWKADLDRRERFLRGFADQVRGTFLAAIPKDDEGAPDADAA